MGDIFILNTGNCHHGNDDLIQLFKTKFDQIMASLQQISAEAAQLRTQVSEMQTAIDTEQQQVTDAIDKLNTSISQLQQQITDGGTAEERQAVLDNLIATRDALASAKTDLVSTIPDATDTTSAGTSGTGSIGANENTTPDIP
jgi:chromosome segregation ATPase